MEGKDNTFGYILTKERKLRLLIFFIITVLFIVISKKQKKS